MSERFTVGEIATIRPGYLTRNPVKSQADGTHRLLQIRDFDSGRSAVDHASLIRFTPESLASAQPLEDGEVVFLARGAKNFACAPTGLPVPTLAAPYFFVLRPNAAVLPEYLVWCLNQPVTLRALSRAATSGAHMPVVRRADLEGVEIPVPALPVQRAIVDLDNLMRKEQSLLLELARKKRELISTVCMTAAEENIGAYP